MTRLLVSVRSPEEALAALEGGADVIDVKEPARGSLGRADSGTVREIVSAVAGRVPLSVALGELGDRPPLARWPAPAGDDVAFAKLGLAGTAQSPAWPANYAAALASFPPGVVRVAVVYADEAAAGAPSADAVLKFTERARCGAILVDTFSKSAGGLLRHWSARRLACFIGAAGAGGLLVAVGGSLDEHVLPVVAECRPHIVAVRTAACEGGRLGCISADRVRSLKTRLRSFADPARSRAQGGGQRPAVRR